MREYWRNWAGDLSPGVRRFIATESLFGIGAGILALILNLHLLELGMNEEQIGQITSLGAIVTGLLSVPAGLLIRFVGRKAMLVIGMLLTGAGIAGFGLATSPAAVAACQFVYSVGLTGIVTSEIQLIFEYCPDKKEERRAYALLFGMFTFFVGVGTLLGGVLPSWLGGYTTAYQYTFFAAAACYALGGGLRGLLLPPSGKAPAAAAKVIPEQPSGRRAKYGPILVLCAVIFLSGVLFGLLNPYLNVIVKYRFGWHDEAISILLTLSGFFLFAGSLLVPSMLEKAGIRKSFVLLFAANALFAFLLALAVPAPVFSVLLLLRGGLFSMLSNLLDSEAMSAVREEDRNLFAGWRTIARSAGNALASYATGWILAASDYRLPFLLAGIAFVLGYVLYLRTMEPILVRREAARRT
ncbi:MFS transporter [Cohnella candidum]|uniref:MFS transporter n=1 Tax=Cohnella candidum TaxID=2674991 RepID=A0A3G3JTX9_9BACL|nr:MFS transporter [Cohnella candidum]AYQ71690.1 MFS transporter [Cohnella candidum]